MKKRIHILLVDDSPTQVMMIKSFIEDEYNVDTAGDGVEAMNYLNNANPLPDLILSDIEMPFMDGY